MSLRTKIKQKAISLRDQLNKRMETNYIHLKIWKSQVQNYYKIEISLKSEPK